MAAEEGKNTYVATVVRDDFFNDPFFKNWWADFDKPMSTWDKTFNRQISGEKKYSICASLGVLQEICCFPARILIARHSQSN